MSSKLVWTTGILMLLMIVRTQAQYEKVWAFGKGAGLDFNGPIPIAIQTEIEGFGEANASVCNENGQLLFYTEGQFVWDRNGNLMPNGIDLNPVSLANFTVISSSSQGAIIVPWPNQQNKYYIFSITNIELGLNAGRLYYSVVDMNLNGGLGDVVPGQKGIFMDSGFTESVTAAAGNRCNVWLIARSILFQQFRVYELTASGLNTTAVTSPLGGSGTGGCMRFSADGEKLAITAWTGLHGLSIYDFDLAMGTISNPILLEPSIPCSGVAFSPDNSKLYISGMSTGNIYQYDISVSATDIAATRALVGTQRNRFFHLKLAENGKIYFQNNNSLGVINQPDLPGALCGYEEEVLQLLPGTSMHAGLTNVVAVLRHDSVYTTKDTAATCWANVNPLQLRATNDSTGWEYEWNTGSNYPVTSADTPGIYWVKYHTPPCNFNVDTFRVSFPNGMLPSIHRSPECRNYGNGMAYAATYPDDQANYHYTWIRGNDTLSTADSLLQVGSGNVTLHISTTTGCDTVLQLHIDEVDYRVSFTCDTLICLGDSIDFHNTSHSQFTAYHWHFGDGMISNLLHPQHLYENAGAYDVMLTGAGAICQDTLYKTITVDAPVNPRFTFNPKAICVGQSIYFYPNIDSAITSLNWDFGNNERTETELINEYQHAFDEPGNFPITLNMNFRVCADTSYTDSVVVYPFPLVDLGRDTVMCLRSSPILLRNLQDPSPSLQRYRWNTSDTTAILKVMHPGTYSLSVAEGPIGCTTTEQIEIKKGCFIDIPNAFSPDGDGINDYFFPKQFLSHDVQQFKMQIFSRWGQLIFETNKPDGRGWDGQFNNLKQPQGAYIYLIEVLYSNGAFEKYDGNVTLVR